MTAEPPPLIGRVLDGTYQIVRPLARGGMGEIYEAVHARLGGKRYAIKVLHPVFASNEEVFRRFRREAEIASQLGHDHIVEVQDFNVTPDSVPYMVMELLEGEDLAARIERGPLPLVHVVHIVDQVASALAAAHQAGIVHRDLKPQNIFLTKRRGSDEFVKVLDFGISKMQDSSSVITRDQSLMGTPFYMSPEQAMGMVRDVDARTDVFALGAIIWEMVTGEMAFASDTIPGALYRVVHEEPRAAHELRRELPPGASALLARAMAKDRDARIASAQDLAAELASLLGKRPTTVYPSAPTLGISAAHAVVHPSIIALRGVPTTMSSAVGQVAVRSSAARRIAPWAAIGTGSVLVGGVVALLSLRGSQSVAPQPAQPAVAPSPAPDAAPQLAPVPVPSREVPTLDVVALRFAIRPPDVDAQVHIDGKPIDGVEAVRLRSTDPLHVRVAAKGYTSWVGDVVPDRERVVPVELAPQHGVRSKRRKTTVTRVEPRKVELRSDAPHIEAPPMTPPAVPAPPPPPPAPKKGGTILD